MPYDSFSFDLIDELINRDTYLYYEYHRSLERYIKQQEDELCSISSYYHSDEPLVANFLRDFSRGYHSTLSHFVSNEIFFDLVSGFKTNDHRFRGRNEVQKIINLTYAKYAEFIRMKIVTFYNDLSKLQTRFRKEKWKIKKIKRIPQPIEPMKITLDIRFGVIKRAKGKCEQCRSSIIDSPIDVFQIASEGKINFIAYSGASRHPIPIHSAT